uniref:Protein AMBP n=1 Tax=Xenopus laevis TaxID=8355 RepID=P70004_XENLA|nr:alpha1-microglobulin/bikunin precursor (AMBP) [Xenopus laevis]
MNTCWALILVPALLALGRCSPIQPEDNIQIQENFDLQRIYGKWYDIAIGSTCKWLKHHKEKFNMGTLELSDGETDGEVRIVNTRMRHGTCSQIVGSYQKTETPGKFDYFNARWGTTIQNYIVFTNYNEYVIMQMRKKKGSETTTTVKLYGRSPDLRPTLVDEFRQFALAQGIPEDSIVMLPNNGECSPGEIEVRPRRTQRAVLPEEEEGSGMENSPFSKNKGESCRLAPASGPCLGNHNRYFYNSSTMACETFQYGGCLGNNNNFHSEKECLHDCRTEAACRLPITPGPCKTAKTHWAFDAAQGKCVTFSYGGCQGNGNQFYTEKECKEYCGVQKDVSEELL